MSSAGCAYGCIVCTVLFSGYSAAEEGAQSLCPCGVYYKSIL